MDNSDGNPLASLLRERLKQSIGNVQFVYIVENYTINFFAPVGDVKSNYNTGKGKRYGS
jgi:hypothetical protein